MAFQAPFEIAQSQLLSLNLTSVDSREVVGGIFPFFDATGLTRFLVIDARKGAGGAGGSAGEPRGGLWVVEEYPLEIRLRKAIYPRPISHYRSLTDLEPDALLGLHHFDPKGVISRTPELGTDLATAIAQGNASWLWRGRECLRDLFFTLDLRRVSGALSRSGLFLRRRLEQAALNGFLRTGTFRSEPIVASGPHSKPTG